MISSLPLACLLAILLLTGHSAPNGQPDAPASDAPASHAMPDIRDLWDRKRPAATERRFMEFLARARAAGDTPYVAELLAHLARARAHQGQFETARAALDEAGSLIDARIRNTPSLDRPMRRARAAWLLERGRYLGIRRAANGPGPMGVRDRAERVGGMKSLLRDAYEAALDAGAHHYAIDAAHLLGLSDSGNEGIEWNRRAIELAETAPDERVRDWLGVLYENTARSLHRLRRWREALLMTRKGLAWAEQHQQTDRIEMFRRNIVTLERLLPREKQRDNHSVEGEGEGEDQKSRDNVNPKVLGSP